MTSCRLWEFNSIFWATQRDGVCILQGISPLEWYCPWLVSLFLRSMDNWLGSDIIGQGFQSLGLSKRVPFSFNMPSFGRHGCSRQRLWAQTLGDRKARYAVGTCLTGCHQSFVNLLEHCRLQRPGRPVHCKQLSTQCCSSSLWHLGVRPFRFNNINGTACIYPERICPPSAVILRVD